MLRIPAPCLEEFYQFPFLSFGSENSSVSRSTIGEELSVLVSDLQPSGTDKSRARDALWLQSVHLEDALSFVVLLNWIIYGIVRILTTDPV